MTPSQKKIIHVLLSGGTIAPAGRSFRLRDIAGRPILNVTGQQIWWLKKWELVRRKKGLFLLDRRTVRQLHGNSFIKRAYKEHKNTIN